MTKQNEAKPPDKSTRAAQAERQVVLVGQTSLHNSIVARFLGDSGEFRCRIVDTSSFDPPRSGGRTLYLLDAADIEECLSILSALPQPAVVALINVPSGDALCERLVIANDIHGIFPSECPPEQLLQGIRAIFDGEHWLPRRLLTGLLLRERNRRKRISPAAEIVLTAKERKILDLLAKGHSNDRIADMLSVSAHTVKTHLYNIYRKIDVDSRLQAVIWAQENRVQPEG